MKFSEKPITKTTIGIEKQESHPSREIIPSFCFLDITLVIEANKAPPPAAEVMMPKPLGPLEKTPSAIKGRVSKTPLPINEVRPLSIIDNLMIWFVETKFAPSINEDITDFETLLKFVLFCLGFKRVITNKIGNEHKAVSNNVLLGPISWIKIPPSAGPTNLEVLKFTEDKAITEGTWLCFTNLGPRDMRMG